MERFKDELQKRLFSMATFVAGLAMLMVFGLMRPLAAATEEVRAFMLGVNAGLLAAALMGTLRSAVKYAAALRNEEKRKALYIWEHDERRLYIQSKTGGDAIQWILSGMVVATVVSEFFNQTVFFTLLGALLFAAAVKTVFKAVYTKKVT